ncbi:MAG: methyltransferase domain-containing protein [Candidatus Thorarchaeota archaeon]|jgi:hypothetical protein
MSSNLKVGIAMCTPIPYVEENGKKRLERVTVEWKRAEKEIGRPTCTNVVEIPVDGLEVGEARCVAVEQLMRVRPLPKFLFFLDYDVIPMFDCLTKLYSRAIYHPDYDIFAGVYPCKSSPPEPLVYKELGEGPYCDWAVGDLLFEMAGVHMGLSLIRTSLFERMEWGPDDPLFKTVDMKELKEGRLRSERGTEDLYFCDRARKEVGAKIMVDTSVLAGHINNQNGQVFGLPNESPMWKRAWYIKQASRKLKQDMDVVKVGRSFVARSRGDANLFLNKDNRLMFLPDGPTGDRFILRWKTREEGINHLKKLAGIRDKKKKELKCLDLGAGGSRREWPGYKTYTTDLRKETNPDYVMDTRYLNFPDETWNRVASSHHLEHLPRWEQEKVWQEMFRVLKFGGDTEHVVPSIEWAGHKLAGGENDPSVFNVLYGAQEASHEIDTDSRDMNTHYFGYTKEIAKALAESVGFVDVELVDWRDDPRLGLNMIIRARKPKKNEKKEETEKRVGKTKTKQAKKSTSKKRKTKRNIRRGAKA